MRSLFVVCCAVAGMWLLACTNTESENVMTDGIHADITVTATGNGQTEVGASMRVGSASNTYLNLSGADQLFAIKGSERKKMTERQLLGAVWYTATFDSDEAETEFAVSFEREVDASAPNSHGTLPAAFSLTAPAASAEFSRANDTITITWEPSAGPDRIHVAADGSCIKPYNDDLDGDPGTTTINPNTFKEPDDEDLQGKDCKVTIELRRTRSGDVDPAFEGGDFVARQVRTVQINSKP
ncbi:MAG: hypothetical protein JXR83_07970 [Deltaproteobacteria bacterium]|nr:hypothetical protein [Deltaproteobacteria bacterium]